VTFVTPVSLLIALVFTINDIVQKGYGGYPLGVLLPVGGGCLAIFVLGAILFSFLKDYDSKEK